MKSRYEAGLPYAIHYGLPGGDHHRATLTFYGDSSHESVGWYCDAAMTDDPEDAAMTDRQKVCLSVRFATLRPFGEVENFSVNAMKQFVAGGWRGAPANQDNLAAGSSIDELANSSSFPLEPNISGYNAARGFTLVVEKAGTKPAFSEDEITVVETLARAVLENIFGEELPEYHRG